MYHYKYVNTASIEKLNLDAAAIGFFSSMLPPMLPPNETRDAAGGPSPDLLFRVDWLMGPNVVRRLLISNN